METAREINACEGHIAAIIAKTPSILFDIPDMWMDLDFPLNISSTRTTVIVMGTLPQSVDLNELVSLDDEVGRHHWYVLAVTGIITISC